MVSDIVTQSKKEVNFGVKLNANMRFVSTVFPIGDQYKELCTVLNIQVYGIYILNGYRRKRFARAKITTNEISVIKASHFNYFAVITHKILLRK